FAFLLTTLIPFTYMENEVNAQSITSMDGQNGCVTSSSSSDNDDDKKDDGDKKDKGDDDDSDSGDISGKQKKNLKTMYEVLHEEYGVSGDMIAAIACDCA